MKRFWVVVFEDGDSWQTFGTLAEVLELFQKDHRLEEVIAIVSH